MTVRELDQVISSLENITIYEPDGKVIVKLDRREESATLEAFGDFVVDEIQYNPTAKCFGLYLKFKRVYERNCPRHLDKLKGGTNHVKAEG